MQRREGGRPNCLDYYTTLEHSSRIWKGLELPFKEWNPAVVPHTTCVRAATLCHIIQLGYSPTEIVIDRENPLREVRNKLSWFVLGRGINLLDADNIRARRSCSFTFGIT